MEILSILDRTPEGATHKIYSGEFIGPNGCLYNFTRQAIEGIVLTRYHRPGASKRSTFGFKNRSKLKRMIDREIARLAQA